MTQNNKNERVDKGVNAGASKLFWISNMGKKVVCHFSDSVINNRVIMSCSVRQPLWVAKIEKQPIWVASCGKYKEIGLEFTRGEVNWMKTL